MQHPKTRLGLDVRVVDDELIVLDVARSRVHRLNQTAKRIWDCCDGHHSSADIAAHLAAAHDLPADRVAADVDETLIAFQRLELLSPST